MRFAIISDIHSNVEALLSVLAEIKKEHVDKIICLGDILGYGPDPKECANLIREKCEYIIVGNHDFACLNRTELVFFNRFAKEAIHWTLTKITEEDLEFVFQLPFEIVFQNIRFVHANPYTPQSWDYILSIDDAIFNFSKFKEQICFIGHSHQPIIYIENNDQKYMFSEEREIKIEPNFRYIINVGSVGQPRDNNPASAFGILDTTKQMFELFRVGYNVEKTQQKMLAAGLPEFLADRLLAGK